MSGGEGEVTLQLIVYSNVDRYTLGRTVPLESD
jgi:hypothetical protein